MDGYDRTSVSNGDDFCRDSDSRLGCREGERLECSQGLFGQAGEELRTGAGGQDTDRLTPSSTCITFEQWARLKSGDRVIISRSGRMRVALVTGWDHNRLRVRTHKTGRRGWVAAPVSISRDAVKMVTHVSPCEQTYGWNSDERQILNY